MKSYQDLTDDEFAELVLNAARLPEVPARLRQAVLDAWRADTPGMLGVLAEQAGNIIRAVLSFDSWEQGGLAMGVRSSGSHTRQLLFSAGDLDIDVRISPQSGVFRIEGQVLGPDEGGGVELEAEPDDPDTLSPDAGSSGSCESRNARLDDLGEFRLQDVPAGTYRLTLHLAESAIVLQPLVVGERTE